MADYNGRIKSDDVEILKCDQTTGGPTNIMGSFIKDDPNSLGHQTSFSYNKDADGKGAASYKEGNIGSSSTTVSGNLDTDAGKLAVAKIAPYAAKCGLKISP
jgi:hypothetical protein